MSFPHARTASAVLATFSVAALSGCGPGPLTIAAEARGGKLGSPQQSESGQPDPRSGQARPPRLPPAGGEAGSAGAASRVAADVLVTSARPLGSSLKQVRTLPDVEAGAVFGTGSVTLRGRNVTVGAVRPSSYRNFSPQSTATSDGVWQAVARGEAVVAHRVARQVDLSLGGNAVLGGQPMRVGAFATTVPGVDVVVNRKAGRRIGITPKSALVLSASSQRVPRLAEKVRGVLGGKGGGGRANVEVLGRGSSGPARPRGSLGGERAAESLGSFSYRYYSDGSIQPDPDWVTANIRTAQVPILGRVTCHKVMFPQLRGALREIREQGLADTINPGQFGGCYAPRFIGSDPSNGVSLHTWGIAVDLNVAGNQRGTRGEIDRRVVAVFKKWGFAWGGDWARPDPMHFELAGILDGGG